MSDTPIEIDLSRLAELARANWADNWNFRSYLMKHCEPRAVDRAAQRLNAEVSAQVDCTKCGNCCREIFPYLEREDVTRLARHVGVADDVLRNRHLALTPEGEEVFNTAPCPMLSGNSCTVYDARPSDCREYPHLHKPDFLERSIGVIENYRICPIIYNVYERMKRAFAYDPAVDYIGDNEVDQ